MGSSETENKKNSSEENHSVLVLFALGQAMRFCGLNKDLFSGLRRFRLHRPTALRNVIILKEAHFLSAAVGLPEYRLL